MCPEKTMINKYLSQHGVALTNNIGGHLPLLKFPATLFLCCCSFFCKEKIVPQCQGGVIATFAADS